ncbi:GNAT family N-acetyltransferase [Chitinophaga nivalis]|uniref:GNAT family N-acetyltransferase n=1 Tax=Chitinophaga nivalis TaxID=2991709 RepID=A0ABT3ITT2_9BACT|nr:GNAT family N-acetyltransferase [Chitinophaga nivalis]MCW3462930.1 GNAT family N-acetyltransferase [Chitinophaga nivalis]MCW3487380.1 GNAT family N-acetyltransferase [Chitinophaga nivalis]
MNWSIKPFEALTTTELYDVLHLRNEVFVVEQQCPYQDLDYADQKAIHVMGRDDKGQLLAYTRIFAPGIKYPETSIGRVVTSPLARGKGAGRELMEKSLEALASYFGDVAVRISAQEYLLAFYTSLGFEQTSDTYMEDNIPHVEMVRKGKA